ncbi:MAG TPA: hypothetical protein DCQ06_09795 [Myxococcales bacterium]|nr:hypothetical protein [Myxococcales bacterium]
MAFTALRCRSVIDPRAQVQLTNQLPFANCLSETRRHAIQSFFDVYDDRRWLSGNEIRWSLYSAAIGVNLTWIDSRSAKLQQGTDDEIVLWRG